MKSLKSTGQATLIEDILNRGLCVRCGACVGICPYFSYWDGQVVALHCCEAESGRCLQFCPRVEREEIGGKEANGSNYREIGPCREIWAARSRDENIRDKAQYGGSVSSLLSYAFENGVINSAVVTDTGDGLSPAGILVKSSSEVLRCAGSRFSASGSLSALNRAIKEGKDHIAVVGLPCQMEALDRMARSSPDGQDRMQRVNLKIGLFCTWALDYRPLRAFLQTRGIRGSVQKCDVPPPPAETFMILSDGEWLHVPLDEIRKLAQKGCSLCKDMTSEKADISVGSVEGREDWNIAVIRTEFGMKLFTEAVKKGFIETEKLRETALAHLREAALNKKTRAEVALHNQRYSVP